MNFQYLSPVENSKNLLDLAFRRAREKSKEKKLKGNPLEILRKKETRKVDVVKESLTSRLNKILTSFPKENELPEFYQKLLRLTLDYTLYKQSFGAVHWAVQRIYSLQKDYARRITKEKVPVKISFLIKQYYGRISSLLKQIGPNLVYLEKARYIMRTYPDIKEMFTVCIYGFPNVGKTTLLNKLAGTKAKVASYAFTTLGINSGFMKCGDQEVQVLDVPGTLSREEKMNPIELQAELVRKELADVIIYVFDLTETGGFPISKQELLFQKIGPEKPVLAYLSKMDLLEKEKKVLADFEHRYYSLEELKEEIGKQVLESSPF